MQRSGRVGAGKCRDISAMLAATESEEPEPRGAAGPAAPAEGAGAAAAVAYRQRIFRLSALVEGALDATGEGKILIPRCAAINNNNNSSRGNLPWNRTSSSRRYTFAVSTRRCFSVRARERRCVRSGAASLLSRAEAADACVRYRLSSEPPSLRFISTNRAAPQCSLLRSAVKSP